MGKGKSKESAAQERANLLGINPIANHAGGTFMSKHSIASSGSNSPLHQSVWDTIKGVGKSISDSVRNSEFNRGSNIDWKGRGSYLSQRSEGKHLFGPPDPKPLTPKQKAQRTTDSLKHVEHMRQFTKNATEAGNINHPKVIEYIEEQSKRFPAPKTPQRRTRGRGA